MATNISAKITRISRCAIITPTDGQSVHPTSFFDSKEKCHPKGWHFYVFLIIFMEIVIETLYTIYVGDCEFESSGYDIND